MIINGYLLPPKDKEYRKMKCPKCRNTMIRKQTSENKYTYECLRCHYVVKSSNDDTQNSVSSDDKAENTKE